MKITLKEKFWGKSLKVDKVENLPGSTEGAYNPFALREEGCVSTLENLAVKFMNSTNSLDEISDADGEVYMSHGGKQSSPVVGVLVNDPDDFSNVRVIYYDAMSKELKKESQPASEKLKAFIWEKDEDGVLKREVTGAEVEVPKVVEIAMDGDRDDIIDFNNPADMEYLFWVNDDIDVISDEEEDDAESGTANCDDDVITCKRDLEDFTRLHIRIDNDVANMPGVSYWMKFENITSGSPSVNIFEAVDESSSYLSDASLAADQIQKQNLTQNGIGTAEIQINTQHIKNGEQISPFIIEGRHEGEGDLTFILKKDGREIYEKSVRLKLHTIDWFYDIFKTSVISGNTMDVIVDDAACEEQVANYPAQSGEYLLFVHGWNMPEWEKARWAETVFKRLWWQGYKGKIGLFSWPTLSGFEGTLYQLLFETRHFDNSEFRSWLSSDSLKGVFHDLNNTGQLRVLAHSMGNVVSGEAIRKYNGILYTYIASQAALSAHCYDNTVNIPVNQTIDVPWWPFDPDAPITTPNLYGHYHSGIQGADPYLNINQYKAGNLRNYYNPNDWALVKWELNNVLKPDGLTPYLYGYTGRTDQYEEGIDRFSRGLISDPFEILSVDNEYQKYQIFAYCDESRVKALGQVDLEGGFSTWNLADSDLHYDNQHYSHSREFRSNIADEWEYWYSVMLDCNFISTIKEK